MEEILKCEQEPGSYSAFIEHGQVFEGVRQRRVVRGQGVLTNVKRPLVHVFSHLIFSPLRVQRSQVVEGLRTVWMIWPENALTHLQRAAQEYFGGTGEDKICNFRQVEGVSASVHVTCDMFALLQVVLQVVQDTQLIKGLCAVCGVFSQGQLFQLERSASQQTEAVLKGLDTYSIIDWLERIAWISVKWTHHVAFLVSSLLSNLHRPLSESLRLFKPDGGVHLITTLSTTHTHNERE